MIKITILEENVTQILKCLKAVRLPNCGISTSNHVFRIKVTIYAHISVLEDVAPNNYISQDHIMNRNLQLLNLIKKQNELVKQV